MPRLGRIVLPDQPLHIVQRGNDRQRIFFGEDDYALYRHWLGEAAREYALAIHAYVLMTNHVHLLATPARAESASRTLQSLGRRYVRYVNTPVSGAPARSGRAVIARRPSRARRTSSPACATSSSIRCGRAWSPIRAAIAGRATPPMPRAPPIRCLSEHPLYRALGATPAERRRDYRALFRAALDPAFVDALRRATNGGWPLGSDRFKRGLAKALARRVTPGEPGRPPNAAMRGR